VVGSHVRKTTTQLDRLLQEPDIAGIEVDVVYLLEDTPEQRSTLLQRTLERVQQAWTNGKTPTIYTSRQELVFEDMQVRLEFGAKVSSLLMDIVQGLPSDVGFLIGKGGITSNDVLSTGLDLTAVRLVGQILPGCSVVRTAADHPLFPNLPVVLFPGNVGDAEALATAHRRFRPVP
ncbi:MAG: four-carbon acid sugar kinase family protein, partial [Coleofasciculaceae cyanobacterium SM2_3_26]|nr:four-carbon acid sugar kinase family protein [Coleofasciculaceae cyanobacterium SM2_3_26]